MYSTAGLVCEHRTRSRCRPPLLHHGVESTARSRDDGYTPLPHPAPDGGPSAGALAQPLPSLPHRPPAMQRRSHPGAPLCGIPQALELFEECVHPFAGRAQRGLATRRIRHVRRHV